MKVINALEPTQEQINAFLEGHVPGEPVFMLNLLKFKDEADYHDGEAVSGRTAYERYAKALGAMLGDQGVEVVFSGDVNGFLIGAGEGAWDAVAIVKYPDAKTMFAMVSSEDYRSIHMHRRAGLAGQLLINCGAAKLF